MIIINSTTANTGPNSQRLLPASSLPAPEVRAGFRTKCKQEMFTIISGTYT